MLSLRELRCTTSFLQAVLLSFLRTRVAGQETCCLQCRTAVFFRFKQRARYAKTNRACLTGVTAADYVYNDIVFGFNFQKRDGLLYDILESTLREIIFECAIIDNNRAVTAGNKTYTSNCLFSSARSPELKLLLTFALAIIRYPLLSQL